MFAIMNRYYGGMYNLQLSTQGFDNAVKVNQVVLDRVKTEFIVVSLTKGCYSCKKANDSNVQPLYKRTSIGQISPRQKI